MSSPIFYILILFLMLPDPVLHHRLHFHLLRCLHFHCQAYLTPLPFDTNYYEFISIKSSGLSCNSWGLGGFDSGQSHPSPLPHSLAHRLTRFYAIMNIFYSLPILRISLLITDKLPPSRILYFYLLIADYSCLPG